MNSLELTNVLAGVDKVRNSHGSKDEEVKAQGVSIPPVLAALRSFTEIVRYLNTRRSAGAVLELADEAAVQDALYIMLRPWILDLVPESPTSKVANRYSIKDFVSQAGRFVIEAKFVRSAEHGKLWRRRSTMISRHIVTIRHATI